MSFVRKIKKETVLELAFLFFLFCFYMMWARIQPLSASPDEKMRYDIAMYIYEHGSLPRGDDPAVRDAVWGISYAFNPILDYIIAAGMMKLVSIVTTQPFALLMAARLISVLCGVGTAFFALRIGKKLFDPMKAWVFAIFISMLPGAILIATYVNTDAMALMATGIIVYAWICGQENGWSIKCCVGLSVGIAICALSYYNAYGFILCSILIFGSTLLIEATKTKDYSQFVKKGILVCILVLILIGWWFVRNYILYDGDFLGQGASSLCAEQYAKAGFKPSDRGTPLSEGLSIWDMFSNGFKENTMGWVELVSRSFVGRFGSLDVCMPNWMENNYLDLIKFGVLLVLIHPVKTFALKKNKVWKKDGIFNCIMLIAMIIPNILNVYYSYEIDYQPQGRYSLPMLIPLAYFMVKGYGYLFDEMVKSPKVRKNIYVALGILLMAGGMYAYFGTFWPEYMEVSFGISSLLSGA